MERRFDGRGGERGGWRYWFISRKNTLRREAVVCSATPVVQKIKIHGGVSSDTSRRASANISAASVGRQSGCRHAQRCFVLLALFCFLSIVSFLAKRKPPQTDAVTSSGFSGFLAATMPLFLVRLNVILGFFFVAPWGSGGLKGVTWESSHYSHRPCSQFSDLSDLLSVSTLCFERKIRATSVSLVEEEAAMWLNYVMRPRLFRSPSENTASPQSSNDGKTRDEGEAWCLLRLPLPIFQTCNSTWSALRVETDGSNNLDSLVPECSAIKLLLHCSTVGGLLISFKTFWE